MNRFFSCSLALAMLLFFPFSFASAQSTPVPAAAPEEITGSPFSPSEDAAPAATPVPARGYVLVTTATQMGFLPLPDEEDYVFPLTQLRTDGTFTENVIHLTPEGVYMESSTCENHDCIDEGLVTLENRKDRILGNMIICLPNQVTLQLLTPEEILPLLSKNESPAE